MISIDAKLTGDLAGDLDRFEAKIKDSVIFSGVAAMARVIYDEVKVNTSGARKGGPKDPPGVKTGTLNNAIYRAYSPEKSSDGVKVYNVSVNKSKAPHWHLIEYGWSRAPAHPYIRPALSRMKDAGDAGMARMTERMIEVDWSRLASGTN
jgi:HK97 gp10 family phage protein